MNETPDGARRAEMTSNGEEDEAIMGSFQECCSAKSQLKPGNGAHCVASGIRQRTTWSCYMYMLL